MPRQLPYAPPGFIGRSEYLAALGGLLNDGAPTVAAVVGTAGVGKTALVVRWAQQVQEHFPDGTLYANLRGYGPGTPPTPDDLLASFLGALGVHPERILPSEVDRAALYRSELAGRRVLVVLDNVTDVTQVRPLLLNGPSRVVVTSRADLKGLQANDGALRIQLPLFDEREAEGLVVAMLDQQPEPEVLAELVRACARLPLAIKVAAGRIATHPDLTITELVGELAAEHHRWDALSIPADEDSKVRTVFEWSYGKLPPDQQLMFRRLGLHPAPEIGAHAAAAVCGAKLSDARRLLADLADQHLIEVADHGRYTCHDLLRAYAADLAEHDNDREEARRRLIEWYAHHARSAYRVLHPGLTVYHERFSLVTGAEPELIFAKATDAWTWATAESVNAIAAVRAAAHHGYHVATVMMGDISTGLLAMAGHRDGAREMCLRGLAAARALGDRQTECWLLQRLGQLYRWTKWWDRSVNVFDLALKIARELRDPLMQAKVLCQLGWGSLQRDGLNEARGHLEAARLLITGWEGYLPSLIDFCLSGVHAGLGDHREAGQHAESSRALPEHSDDSGAEARPMAGARKMVGKGAKAVEPCDGALAAESEHEAPRIQALLLKEFGDSLRFTGDVEQAIARWREALVLLEERGDHHAPQLRKRLAALLSADAG
ncbi:AAA family ATPase [Nocardia sp. NRRL S-836]|uniref:ATP-binding protein n=1 Tax=Nocardia sp. NRRL S-836 TaxID=1519492 RepID=UPI0006AF1B75|nr:AAA family ATPase [Nocardia sp. NRRL S-836]